LDSALARQRQAATLVESVDEGDSGLERLRREQAELETELADQSEQLSALRARVASTLAKAVTADLRRMLMPKAEFRVEIWQVEDGEGILSSNGPRLAPGPVGWDRVSFDLAANPGDPPRPLADAASGGELSRVALALLSHLTESPGSRRWCSMRSTRGWAGRLPTGWAS